MRYVSDIIITLMAILSCLHVSAADNGRHVKVASRHFAYREMPARLDGSMMPYDLSVNEKPEGIVPDSLEPIFINYLGRHGARYLSSANKVEKIKHTLLDAQDAGSITETGRRFLQLIDRVISATSGRWGALDSIGEIEQTELARQLVGVTGNLLHEGRVNAVSTYVPRVVMSMYMFCHSLAEMSTDIEISTDEGRDNSPLLRYFDTDSVYRAYLKSGGWIKIIDKYEEQNVSTAPARRLVGENFQISDSKLRKMTLQMYGILQSLRATGMGVPTNEWMTESEYRQCWAADNLDHYLRRTDTSLSDEPGRAAGVLLKSFIEYGDLAAERRDPGFKAMLRFGHAETLMPVLSLMKVPGCHYLTDDFGSVSGHWRDYDVVPLASNICVVSYSAPSGEVYCAMRFNGRYVDPMSDGRKIVKWSELRQYWNTGLKAVSQE